uniref:Uncharacterized protein n=1 Tax=Haptolina brevifila TaxID=156173 RepID=A0A7S2N458_9EUKA|mmetsp:Transcript_65840/g.130513  ORF Transcript_65840/g.130513 Transcript_65840/m.130513 type:complete len:131 (+) Transcript_65840:170-562(+)
MIVSLTVDDEVYLSVNVNAVVNDLLFIVAQTSFGILPTFLACLSSPNKSGPISTAKILGGACGLIAFAFSPAHQRVQIGRMLTNDSPAASPDDVDSQPASATPPAADSSGCEDAAGTGLSMDSMGFGLKK